MTDDAPALALRGRRALEYLHSMIYFAPEQEQQLTAIGLRPGRMGYFASRSAAMGAVTPAVVTATFYNFSPALVARHIPAAWALASPSEVLVARLAAVDAALRRLLGPELLASPGVAEAADLARIATEACEPAGRVLYAAHADLDWPEAAHLRLWHAVTLLREHRGDGHIAALLAHDLNGIDAIVTHTATGDGFVEEAARRLRGWSEDEWAASITRLRERGLVAEDGLALTDQGRELRDSVEADTDRMGAGPWRWLGSGRAERLIALGRPLSRQVAVSGAFPPGVFAGR